MIFYSAMIRFIKHNQRGKNEKRRFTMHIKRNRQNCTGQQCITCRRCYIRSNDNTIIEAVKTNGRPKSLPKITVIKSNRV